MKNSWTLVMGLLLVLGAFTLHLANTEIRELRNSATLVGEYSRGENTKTTGRGAEVYVIHAYLQAGADEATIVVEDTLGNTIAVGENGSRFYLDARMDVHQYYDTTRLILEGK